MSATFACPHCGATYPRKPVLVGRAVRCTTCKNAFCLREDGIADAVSLGDPPVAQPEAQTAAPATPKPAEPTAPQPVPKPTANTPPPANNPPPKLSTGWGIDLSVEVEDPAPIAAENSPAVARETESLAKSPSAPPPNSTRKLERLTARQMDARREMAATLATSMGEALKSESVKREEKSAKSKVSTEGKVGKIGPAVLTGQGVTEARESKKFILYSLVAIIVIAALWWLIFTNSPQQAALAAFTIEVDTQRIRSGQRIQAIQERAWLVGLPPAQIGVPPVIDMHDARIGAARSISLAAGAPAFASIKDLVPVEPGPVWVPADRVAELEQYRSEDQKEKDFIATVLKREKVAVSHPALLQKIQELTGMNADDVQIIDLFLRGRTSTTATEGHNDIVKRWIAGDIPAKCEIIRFSGNKGLMLLSRGQTYKTNEVTYEGQLLRFVGQGWPEEWKILTLSTALKSQF
jgi:hypothetical protein